MKSLENPPEAEGVSLPDAGLVVESRMWHVSPVRNIERADDLLDAFVERRTVSAPASPSDSSARSTPETAEADRERLLTIFTHDLRNLLGVLSLNTELLLKRRGESAETNANNMRRAIGRMDRLVGSLYDLGKLNSGKLNVAIGSQDLAEVLREAVEIFQPLAFSKNVELTLAGAERPLNAKIDHDRIFQVLSNLLSNAVKFTPEGGKISVSATEISGTIRVAVRDTGIGIPEGDLERVFECYRQLGGSGLDGLGLGLFISKAVVSAHRGRIWATSGPAGGSSFFFTVPMAERRRVRPPSARLFELASI